MRPSVTVPCWPAAHAALRLSLCVQDGGTTHAATVVGGVIGGGVTLGGVVVVERIFGIPGMGSFMVDGAFARDFPVLQACTVTFLAIVLFGMVNYLSLRHYERFHWNAAPFAQLSGQSRRLLENTAQDIRIVALIRPTHEAYRGVAALLQEYAARSSGVSIEFVDPDRDRARTEQLVRQYGLAEGECVVFEIGGRHQVVAAADLVAYGDSADDAQSRVFRGEQLFSSAIYSLTQAARTCPGGVLRQDPARHRVGVPQLVVQASDGVTRGDEDGAAL